jgi:peptidoglycan/xylan/chitin deacetylase (PgdA/CDA1 family)
MVTPYPDYRHYTSRDYGNRVGIFRLLDAFASVGARASFVTNAAIAERYPELLADILAAGHEIVAHSTDMNGTIASGMETGAEQQLIAQTIATFTAAGVRPHGWMSLARSQSFTTPALLAEQGFRYMADWVNDELPYTFSTPSGPLVNVPVNHELSDRQVITVQQNSADSYCTQLRDAFTLLSSEAMTWGGRMLPIHLTPYISGLPYRIASIENLLVWLKEQPTAAFATLGEIADDFLSA